MAKELQIECDELPSDVLSVSRLPGDSSIRLSVEGECVFIGASKARELFNWLGVELHKGGLSDG